MVEEALLHPDIPVNFTRDALSETTVSSFRSFIHRFYEEFGRDLPWRNTRDPYRILVSEIMLQQTQVDRVLKKYTPFIERYPDIGSLHRAPLNEVLALWQGLGYNRRCLALKRCAALITSRYGGVVPDRMEELLELPGVGGSTAAGILIFAFNEIAVYLETNIRNVYIHLFFPGRNDVHDREILPLLEQTLDRLRPREWCYGLMDYGSLLKKRVGNLNARSRHYTRQPPFEGSERQLRGRILALLLEHPVLSEVEITDALSGDGDPARVTKAVATLVREGFVSNNGSRYTITD
jgi:A/G-specific adenine glycosylase